MAKPQQQSFFDVAIIGGGASGLMAAASLVQLSQQDGLVQLCQQNAPAQLHQQDGLVQSAQQPQLEAQPQRLRIGIFEASKRVGTPILRSGNGRCNFSHRDCNEQTCNAKTCNTQVHDIKAVHTQVYHNAEFVQRAFEFAASAGISVLDSFKTLGLVWQESPEGLLFPYSNKASSVLEVLRAALDESVEIFTETPVDEVVLERQTSFSEQVLSCAGNQLSNTGNQLGSAKGAAGLFCIKSKTSVYYARAVVLACGSGADQVRLPLHDADQVRLPLQRVPLRPVLGPLATDTAPLAGLDGVRVKARVSLPQRAFSEVGEVLFRTYGVSGIVIFNASRFAQVGDTLLIDFAPDKAEAELSKWLKHRLHHPATSCSALDFMRGTLVPSVVRAVFKQAGINPDEPFELRMVEPLARALKQFSLTVKGTIDGSAKNKGAAHEPTKGNVSAHNRNQMYQVQRGGISVAEVDPRTMETLNIPGLYVTGEALDVDGPCGGYNLHWAWLSGLLAARSVQTSLSEAGLP